MPIVNRTPYPTAEIEEICRFVLGSACDAVLAETTLIISDRPDLLIASGVHLAQDVSAADDEVIALYGTVAGQVSSIGVAQPRRVVVPAREGGDPSVALSEWRERLVHNLAIWCRESNRLPDVLASPDAGALELVLLRQGAVPALHRYWEAAARHQFSWQR